MYDKMTIQTMAVEKDMLEPVLVSTLGLKSYIHIAALLTADSYSILSTFMSHYKFSWVFKDYQVTEVPVLTKINLNNCFLKSQWTSYQYKTFMCITVM